MLARRADLLQVGDEILRLELLGLLDQQVAVADDRVERRTQLVAHVRQELRLRRVRRLGGVARQLELVRALLEQRAVALDLLALPLDLLRDAHDALRLPERHVAEHAHVDEDHRDADALREHASAQRVEVQAEHRDRHERAGHDRDRAAHAEPPPADAHAPRVDAEQRRRTGAEVEPGDRQVPSDDEGIDEQVAILGQLAVPRARSDRERHVRPHEEMEREHPPHHRRHPVRVQRHEEQDEEQRIRRNADDVIEAEDRVQVLPARDEQSHEPAVHFALAGSRHESLRTASIATSSNCAPPAT